jgi:hypothetical protein
MDSIDFGRALKAPFNDKGWPGKTALGFLWLLLGITSPVVYGAQLEYITRVSNGNEELPDWSDFGSKWVKGFLVSVAGFIYFLPIIILGMIMIVPGIISAAMSGDSNAAGGLLAGGGCLFSLIATVYVVAVSVLFYAAIVHYAVKGNFGAFFQFGEILGHVRDGSGYFVAWMWSLVIGFGVGAVMSVLSATGIGAIVYPAAIYLMTMITGHLFGQWAAKSYGYPGLGSGAPAYPAAAPGGYAPPPPPAHTPPAAPAQPAPPAAPQGYAAPSAPPAYTPPAPVAPAPVAAPEPPAYVPPAAPAPVAPQPPAYEPPAAPAPVAPQPPAYEPPAAPAPSAPEPPAPDAAFAPPADPEPPVE